MCGIYGVISNGDTQISYKEKMKLTKIYLKSRRRGKDSTGLITFDKNIVNVFKNNGSDKFFNLVLINNVFKKFELIMGHTRLSTHSYGSGEQDSNQPLISGNWICLHNGILTNHKELSEKIKKYEENNLPMNSVEEYKSDTHVLVKYIDYFSSEFEIRSILEKHFLGEISVVLFNISTRKLIIFSNNENLYLAKSKEFYYIASEISFFPKMSKSNIHVVKYEEFGLGGYVKNVSSKIRSLKISNTSNTNEYLNSGNLQIPKEFIVSFRELYKKSIDKKMSLSRCSKCGLPATFPKIYFDKEGTCKHCINYAPSKVKGEAELYSTLNPDGKTNKVLVCLSGGRDSCFALHKIKEMGFEPIAYTYDWGFISEAARENMAKMCGKMKIQHILVSPNLYKTRLNVRKTLIRWAKRCDVSLLPILMSQDKAFFFYAQKISKELGGIPIILADHQFEKTNFKSLLAGSREDSFNAVSGALEYRLNYKNLLFMMLHFIKILIQNPTLIIIFTKQASISAINYYVLPHRVIHIFEYIDWIENEVEEVLSRQYDWGTGIAAARQTWRMGDITSPFYNLIYRLKLGFDEHDTMLANLIRANKKKLQATSSETDFENNALQVYSYLKVLNIEPISFIKRIGLQFR